MSLCFAYDRQELAFSTHPSNRHNATPPKRPFVGDDFYVGAGGEGDFLGVAAADVEVVPVEGGVGLVDGRLEEFVPGFFAELVEAAAAEVVLVGFAVFRQGWWPSSRPGQRWPSVKSAEPMPVPRVRAISTPLPLMAP